MDQFDADFHIHSKYSGGTSKDMEIPLIAEQAQLKGLDLVGTGDALNPSWLSHLKGSLTEEADGVYVTKGSKTRFLITTEVEDDRRVHHIIILPSLPAAQDLYERYRKYSKDIDRDGRPHLSINAIEVVDHAKEVGGMVGPAHAFTPWTAIYKSYGSFRECYGDNEKHVKFLELGLSADSDMADRIPELSERTFLTNSDTHSPWPHRLGREFNRILVKELSFTEIKAAIERTNGRKFLLNVGLNPKEGKYHLTACTRCFLRFRLEDAINVKWRCPECKGLIKKGVADRIGDLAQQEKPQHPDHRPPYMHILPLAEVISLVTGIKTMTSKKIKDRWDALTAGFGTEINILVDADVTEIKKKDPEVGKIIEKFRAGKINYVAGGGGQYGRPTLDSEEERYYGKGQKTLADY